MEHRPRITIEAGRTDRVMDAVGWFLFALLIALSVYAYFDLPDTISVHTGKGSDSKGDKALILLLPIIGIALFAGMKILMQYPHRFNYLTKITPENARTQYTARSE